MGYPKTIGRCFSVGPKVRIGRGAVIGNDVAIDGDVFIGERVTIESGALLVGTIIIGSDTQIGRQTYIGTGPSGRVVVGESVLINNFSSLGAFSELKIGDRCIFAAYLQATDATHGVDQSEDIKDAPIDSRPVSIGEGVWLGSHVVVLMGANIGAGAAIGAHSLVNCPIPDNVVAYGIPARVRRHRRSANA
jgi:acetyltransferase-like isoleucine patch superfamily enzyme